MNKTNLPPCAINYIIRSIREEEYPLLDHFLYEAIFVPEGEEKPSPDIISLPELQVYTENFGKEKDDISFVAEVNGRVVGAVWTRVMDDYGHIADGIPSFAISVDREYRKKGIGTTLMKRILSELKKRGYPQASLSVQKANHASKLYLKLGFRIHSQNEEEYIMVYCF